MSKSLATHGIERALISLAKPLLNLREELAPRGYGQPSSWIRERAV